MSTVQRSLKGSLAGSAAFVVQVVLNFAAVPVMLEGWGTTPYALWVACQAGMTLLLTFDAGFQTYAGYEMAKLFPIDRDRLRSVLGSALRFALVLGSLELVAVGLLWAIGRLDFLLGVPNADIAHYSLDLVLVALLGSWAVAWSAGGTLTRVYPPAGLYARVTWWYTAQRTLLVTVAAAVAAAKGSLLLAAGGVAIVTLLMGSAFCVDAWRSLRSLRPFLSAGSLVAGSKLFIRSLPLTASTLLVQLQTSGLVLFVLPVFGGTGVALLTTMRTLANVLVQAAGTVFAPAIPELVRFDVLRESRKFQAGLLALTVVATLPTAVGSLILAGAADALYGLWTRDKIPFDQAFFSWIAMAALWRISGMPLVNHLNAMNDVRWVTGTSVAQTVALAIIGVPASHLLGMVGVAIGIFASEIVGAVALPTLWLCVRSNPAERNVLLRSRVLAALTPLAASSAIVATLVLQERYRWLVLAMGAVVVVLAFVLQARAIPADFRQQVWSIVRKRWRR